MLTSLRRLFLAVILGIVFVTACLKQFAAPATTKLSQEYVPLYHGDYDRLASSGASLLSNSSLSLPTSSADNAIDYTPSNPPRVALITAATKKEALDLDWIHTDLPEVQLYTYIVNDRKAALHTPRNKGHEAMVYLTFLIDHYDFLADNVNGTAPDILIFMHSHRRAWHNLDTLGNDAVQMIRRLRPAHVFSNGYVNLRCPQFPGCPSWLHPLDAFPDPEKSEQAAMAPAWAALFPSIPLPEVLAAACCSQFALSRERALSLPRVRYEQLRDWLVQTRLKDSVSGRIFEYVWQFIFLGQAVACPDEVTCHCVAYGVCFQDQAEYDAWHRIRTERDRLSHEVLVWRKQKKKAELAVEKGMQDEWWEVQFPGEGGRLEALEEEVERLQVVMRAKVAEAIGRGDEMMREGRL